MRHISRENRLLIGKFVRNIAVFRNISESSFKQLLEDFSVVQARKNQDILRQTDDSTDLYIVLKGKVRVSLLSSEGEEFVLADLGVGDFFGEMSLIDGKPRSACVIAEDDTALGVLKRERFLKAMREEPNIAIDLLTSLVRRLRQTDEMVERFAFLDVRKRLLLLLARIVELDGALEDEKGCYRIKKRTHRDLAGRIGVSRESVSKILKALSREKKVLEREGHFIISRDVLQPPDVFLPVD